ncbi:MAG: VWA domain-containing protein [Anaerolineales bacterium]|nr:VWA domain-containing protein [Anaerolineales bacterium]
MADRELEALRARWLAEWPAALACWSRFTKLSEPRWCLSAAEAKQAGLTQSFAMIRLDDHAVVINLAEIQQLKLAGFAREILAHEIGHHVYCPADLTDNARLIARVRWGLPTREHQAGLIANLYADLLLNDRLQRGAGLRLDAVYQALRAPAPDGLWALYMRMYEILWSLPRGTLAGLQPSDQMEGDAQLGARLVRHYAREWLAGAGKFAALCLPYLLEEPSAGARWLGALHDLEQAGRDGFPSGLTEMDADERASAIHPALDPALNDGLEAETPADLKAAKAGAAASAGGALGQCREPFEYGAILKALGLKLDDHELAVRYYRERAVPYLIPFPERRLPQSVDPLPEGLDPWDIGAPLEDVDWLQSVLVSPRIVPGLTTVQRVWGDSPGQEPAKEPLDLDLYVDCSGSMPNPQQATSYLTLAGAIVALSALRTGARVQATLWSGARQFLTTAGFVRDEAAILRILTGYLGGATAFPIHILRDTFSPRRPSDRPAHILILSDDGVTTMFDKDELGQSGWEIAAMALKQARGGGTMVLNLYQSWEKNADLVKAHAQGWQLHVVRSWEDLVTFAREFSRAKYGE